MDFFMTGEIAPLFVRWSLPHWAALGIVALAAGGLLWGCRRLRMESRLLVGKVLGSLFLLTFLMETFGRIVREHWEPWQDRLPRIFAVWWLWSVLSPCGSVHPGHAPWRISAC